MHLVICSGMLALPLGLGAQASSATPLSGVKPSNATDTGAFAPGHVNFARYSVPGLCLVATLSTRDILRRTRMARTFLDTIRATAPERDTLPAEVAAVGRACGAHFTVTETAAQDLPDLFALALLEGNDSLAHAVVQRRFALASTSAARDTVLSDALTGYLAAEPARVVAAESIVVQMDAFGLTQALPTRLAGHLQLLEFGNSMFNQQMMRVEANRIIALGHVALRHGLRADDSDFELALIAAYRALAEITAWNHPDSLRVLAHVFQEDMLHYPFAVSRRIERKSADRVMSEEIGDVYGGADVGRQLPPLEADFWFPRKPDMWPPGPGRISLIVVYNVLECRGDPSFVAECERMEGDLSRWVTQYGAHGLNIAIVAATQGFAWAEPSQLWTVALPPAEEADTIAYYVRDYLKLPATVAVIKSKMRQLPVPDGRRWFNDLISKEACYQFLSEGRPKVLLVRDGRVLYAGGDTPLLNRLLHQTFEALAIDGLNAPSGQSMPSVPDYAPRALPEPQGRR